MIVVLVQKYFEELTASDVSTQNMFVIAASKKSPKHTQRNFLTAKPKQGYNEGGKGNDAPCAEFYGAPKYPETWRKVNY